MLFLLAFLFGMGLIDSLNPFSIAVHIFLLGVLKNTNRIAFYVLGIWVVYFVGGMLIFTGLTSVLDGLAGQFTAIPDLVLYGLESVLGVILVVYGLVEFRKKQKPRELRLDKDVSSWTLVLLGGGGTLSDLPTALPYLGFIAKMTEMNTGLWLGCGLLLVYNVIYILPLLLIWVLYLMYKDAIRDRMELVIAAIEKTNRYIIVAFCEIVGILFIIDSIFYYFGSPLQW
ncbi:MAG: GAP family protein [Chloroflexi bacterium]|nr:GAP family protein [Chloroflexota bacterium]